MNEEEIQEQLVLELAKNVLTSSLASRDNLVKSLTAIAAVCVPSYIAMLRIFANELSAHVAIKAIPVALFVAALIACFLVMFPRSTYFDFKNPQQIIDNHYELLRYLRNYAILACVLEVMGLLAIGYVFIS